MLKGVQASYGVLQKRQEAILQKMAKVGPFIMATATHVKVRCGNPNCKCAKKKEDRHEQLHLSWTDAGQPMFDAAKEERMEWIVVFKEGSMSTLYPWVMSIKNLCAKGNVITEIDEEEIEDRQRRSHEQRLQRGRPKHKKRIRVTETTYTWMSGIDEPSGERSLFNVMTCKEEVDGGKTCDYVWLTSDGLNLCADNVKELTQRGGRCRWKIENEGINTQKNGGYCLEHLYSRDKVSMKIWCALIDIAHLINQLIEQGSLISIKTYGSVRNIAQKMFEHLLYYVFRKPPDRPRIQIRLGWNSS